MVYFCSFVCGLANPVFDERKGNKELIKLFLGFIPPFPVSIKPGAGNIKVSGAV
jgi:hypothetical protein